MNNLLEGHNLLIFEKLDIVLEVMDIVACHRLGKVNRVIVKLLNCKDSQYILERKYNQAILCYIITIRVRTATVGNSSLMKAFAHIIESFMVW